MSAARWLIRMVSRARCVTCGLYCPGTATTLNPAGIDSSGKETSPEINTTDTPWARACWIESARSAAADSTNTSPCCASSTEKTTQLILGRAVGSPASQTTGPENARRNKSFRASVGADMIQSPAVIRDGSLIVPQDAGRVAGAFLAQSRL